MVGKSPYRGVLKNSGGRVKKFQGDFFFTVYTILIKYICFEKTKLLYFTPPPLIYFWTMCDFPIIILFTPLSFTLPLLECDGQNHSHFIAGSLSWLAKNFVIIHKECLHQGYRSRFIFPESGKNLQLKKNGSEHDLQ